MTFPVSPLSPLILQRTPSQDPCGVCWEQGSKSLEAFAWGDNAYGCLGLPTETSAALLPRPVEPYGLLPSERVVAVSCSERCVHFSRDSVGTLQYYIRIRSLQ